MRNSALQKRAMHPLVLSQGMHGPVTDKQRLRQTPQGTRDGTTRWGDPLPAHTTSWVLEAPGRRGSGTSAGATGTVCSAGGWAA